LFSVSEDHCPCVLVFLLHFEPLPFPGTSRWSQRNRLIPSSGIRYGQLFLCNAWKKCNELTHVGGVSIRSKKGAPSRKGCVVHCHMTEASNKL
ncbi:unnamed protein product, partial [Sphacelaria rigidula]